MLLLLSPVAVKTQLRRQHISKELIPGGLTGICGQVNYGDYQALR